MLLNIQGFDPSATSSQRWKVEHLSNLISDSPSRFLVIALTETWLKPHISDTLIDIEPFTSYRVDRVNREHGGVLLYIHKQIPVSHTEQFDDDICQAVFCVSSVTSYMFASIYKPCDASNESFSRLLHFLQNCISSTVDSYKYTKVFLGDFNFPDLWRLNESEILPKTINECSLINFMNDNFLCQYINVATRVSNILDICLSNNDRFVQHLKSEKLEISDHNVVEITIPNCELTHCVNTSFPSDKLKVQLQGFNALNLFKADFSAISESLEQVDWDSLWASSSLEKFPQLLSSTVLDICKQHCPLKGAKKSGKSAHEKSYHTLLRKKKKLNARLSCIKSINPLSPKIKTIESKINKLLNELKSLTFSKQEKDEINAIAKIKSNPKFFYSYAKKRSISKQSISQIFNAQGKLISDRQKIANSLQDQFVSSFSDPSNPDVVIPTNLDPELVLSQISFNSEDMLQAIDETKTTSSCPDHFIPAIVLKKCKSQLVKPLLLLWNESFNTGTVPAYYKQALVTPVFKKGSRIYCKNYRPISLTAHEVKIFERIIKNKVIEFLESNFLLTSNQHGFRKGRSCLTQLEKLSGEAVSNSSMIF